jgi:hypothetical protein
VEQLVSASAWLHHANRARAGRATRSQPTCRDRSSRRRSPARHARRLRRPRGALLRLESRRGGLDSRGRFGAISAGIGRRGSGRARHPSRTRRRHEHRRSPLCRFLLAGRRCADAGRGRHDAHDHHRILADRWRQPGRSRRRVHGCASTMGCRARGPERRRRAGGSSPVEQPQPTAARPSTSIDSRTARGSISPPRARSLTSYAQAVKPTRQRVVPWPSWYRGVTGDPLRTAATS